MSKKHSFFGLQLMGISAVIFLMGTIFWYGYNDMDCDMTKNDNKLMKTVCDFGLTGFYFFFTIGFILLGMGIYNSFRPLEDLEFEKTI